MNTTIVFVHGFTGSAETWGSFGPLLKNDARFAGYTPHFWAYPSTLNPLYAVTQYIWTDDPGIETVGQSLRTYLTTRVPADDRLMLIGHSMGGLVIQAFLIEELARGERRFLDRITEIVFCGTPSNGLLPPAWLGFIKGQVEDMAASGRFIQKLRSAWKTYVDDERSNPQRLARFRVTPIAGERDKFVPPASSVDAFPLDEKFSVPGDHVAMVKPHNQKDLIYEIIADRCLHSMSTPAEAKTIAVREADLMSQVVTASEFNDVEALRALIAEVEKEPKLPRVERELGLALLGHQQYAEAARLLRSYLDSPEHAARPVVDVQAVQQLAIALSGTGEHQKAVAELNKLPPVLRDDPETQGIMAGRFKRHWLKNPDKEQIGWRAYEVYRKAYDVAVAAEDPGQIVYNGINAAYMSYALGKPDVALLNQLLTVCAGVEKPNYWDLATKAEAQLLLGNTGEAEQTYREARTKPHEPRYWSTTGQQALDILRRGKVSAPAIEALFATIGTA
jgi:pimeloyl-ACP methyl ester carboxylesterase